MTGIEVELVSTDDLKWTYRDQAPAYPTGRYHRSEVDPCPCYHHDVDVVLETIEHVTTIWPNPVPVKVWVLQHEELGRTNGHSEHSRAYYEDPGTLDYHGIVLSGKRVPPHPAMTRYLVAHEYGHHVQWWVQEAMGYKYDYDHLFEEEIYAPLRDIEYCSAGPGTWHKGVGEVFACDFRTLICEVELEFWPHAPIPRPEDADLKAWWKRAQDLDFSQVARTPPPEETTT